MVAEYATPSEPLANEVGFSTKSAQTMVRVKFA
jgi:hypothetical protein